VVTAAIEALATADRAVADKIPHEMLLLDLYGALRQLDSLTGESTADDILNLIFSTLGGHKFAEETKRRRGGQQIENTNNASTRLPDRYHSSATWVPPIGRC
jgi:hypothetical protein